MRKGTEFLKSNLLQEGVKELENGLQYRVLAEGEGPSPRLTDSVRVHYKAMFTDGTVWESTTGSEPLSLTVGSAGIRGIVNALQKMKAGDKWKLFIPSDLAFGVQGDPSGLVGPNQVLVYELELLEIMK
jgi:FKBP-type peptidyl-prolyl cis-trans isomerase